jgi:hypothetical protein
MTDASGLLEKEPEKEQEHKAKTEKPWLTLISLGAMAVALVSAGFTYAQVAAAKQQNVNAEQQELVSLVGAIAQYPASIDQQSEIFKHNYSAISQTQTGDEFTELADSEEAVNLIGLLDGKGVTAIEYYETAVGLQLGESDALPLQFLAAALRLTQFPETRASIWRLEAQIYYETGSASSAERADTLAGRAFDNASDVATTYPMYNLAYTKLFDAYYQAAIPSCANAWAEVNTAVNILRALRRSPAPPPPSASAAVARYQLKVARSAGEMIYSEYVNDKLQLRFNGCAYIG